MGKAARRKEARRTETAQPQSVGQRQSVAQPFRMNSLLPALIAVAGFVAYHNSLRGVFLFDDIGAILQNTTIQSLSPPWGPLSAPARSVVTGRPLVNLSLALNYAWGGFDVGSYHLFNIAMHALAGLVLYGVIRRTLAAPSLRAAFGGDATSVAGAMALLWVVHPLTSETVDYTIQRTELLMGLFFLLTLYSAARAFASARPNGWYGAALAAFVGGLGCKEIIVVAPLVVFVYDWLIWSKSPRIALARHWKLYAGFVLVSALYLVSFETNLRRAFVGVAGRSISPWNFALTQSGVILRYLRLAIWPAPLVGDYEGWPLAKSVLDVWPSFLIVVGLIGLTVWGLVRGRPLAFLGVWFFAILAPTSSFKPILKEVVAERRMYLPLAALIVLAVLGGENVLRRLEAPRVAGTVIVALLAMALGWTTVRRNEDYRSTLSFWTDVVAKRPDNWRARMWLGDYYFKKRNSPAALPQLQEAVRLDPRNGSARYSLGIVLASLGKTEEAIEQFHEAVRSDPTHVRAHYNFALALMKLGRNDEAIEQLSMALHIDPNFKPARAALGQVGATR